MRRILQISDVHFGPPSVPTAVAAVLQLVATRKPDLVVLAGDLTQRAKPWQFTQARDFVDRMPCPTFVVPGNHDVPLYRVWERLFQPFGAYRRGFAEQLEPTWKDDELDLFGINTAHGLTTSHGRFTARRLRELSRYWPSAEDGQSALRRCRIVVAHHPMELPASFHGQKRSWRSDEAGRRFSAAGVEVVLSGHVHHFFCGPVSDLRDGLDNDFLLVHSGTACSNRGRPPEVGCNSCNWLEIDDRQVTVERLELEVDGSRAQFVSRTELRWRRASAPAG